jgi:NADP-dependent 3-hydroxy acid dehydrogenase YdfG
MVRRFADAGCRVVLTARREAPMRALVDELDAADRMLVAPADVRDFGQWQTLVDTTLAKFGQIDVLINNAGNAVAKPIAEASPEEIDLVLDVNLRGVAYGCRAVVPHMIERGDGFILNVGSVCSVRAFPAYASYCAAKFGVMGLSKAVYEEVREHGVRVHCLCPAAVNTPWSTLAGGEDDLPWPREQRIQPEDLAELALMCIRLPRRLAIDQMTVWPTCESTV